jgi:pimeloyl-ACP methyl ester carboxylesterase
MSGARDSTITTADGGVLAIQEGGDPAGRPVLVHGGTPNSRLLYQSDAERAGRQGIRLISYDRPGYGGSTPRPGRSVADCVEDVRAIATALGIDRLAVWGVSGGGPHALACAALLPELVPAVASIASVGPYATGDYDYFSGMGELNVEDIKLFHADRAAAREKCARDREEMLAASPEQLIEILRTLLSPVDAAVLSRELVEHAVRSIQSGLGPGDEGWWEDNVAIMEPWGFELGSIRTPVLLRHGREDLFVPFAHGEWLAGQIPGVEAILTDDDGHLTQTEHHLESIHAWLLERLN